MNKLWIYGCSFSTDYTRKFCELEGKTWYEYVSDKFNLEIENYAYNGHGIVSTILEIIKTQSEWREDDLVIIQLPDSQRIDIPTLSDSTNPYAIEKDKGELVDRMKTRIRDLGLEHMDSEQIILWDSFISLLNLHSNKNIYTWFIHHTTAFGEYAKHTNSLYDGSVMDWINQNKAYINEEDKHFSPTGAKKFYQEIIPKINYGK
jgi:hypothetical protein